MPWHDRRTPAVERILDAADTLFATHGVRSVTMAEIAVASSCSRATLYRYFPDRASLDKAFTHRAALRVGRLIMDDLAGVAPEQIIAEAVLSAVRHVRDNPALAAWFADPAAGRTADLATESEVIEAIGGTLASDPDASRWLVRVIVSLLTSPGRDADDERRLVERFVAPVVALGQHETP